MHKVARRGLYIEENIAFFKNLVIFKNYFAHCMPIYSCMTFSFPRPLWQHQNDSQVDVGYWLAGVQRHGIFGHETLFAQRLGGQECPGLWRTRL